MHTICHNAIKEMGELTAANHENKLWIIVRHIATQTSVPHSMIQMNLWHQLIELMNGPDLVQNYKAIR